MPEDIDPALLAVHTRTQDVYDRAAQAFDQRRAKSLFERGWLDRFTSKLPASPTVLDVGCGTGRPISSYLMESGAVLTGFDFAPGMLAIARERYPNATWIEGDMRDIDLGQTFNGVLSWDGFFHLSRAEQRDVLPRLAQHVREGGCLMVTTGPADGEATGTVDGEAVYHASLDPAEYTAILSDCGFRHVEIVVEDPECDFHSIAFASQKAS
ncbi:MAG: class I SAM-dependent methyltransferase [Pseudomonadota bacterium]